MNVLLWILLAVLALAAGFAWFVKTRSRDIEEVILQGRPVLLRCSKDRIEGRTTGCQECDPHMEGC
jgi:hypothetical protein